MSERFMSYEDATRICVVNATDTERFLSTYQAALFPREMIERAQVRTLFWEILAEGFRLHALPRPLANGKWRVR